MSLRDSVCHIVSLYMPFSDFDVMDEVDPQSSPRVVHVN